MRSSSRVVGTCTYVHLVFVKLLDYRVNGDGHNNASESANQRHADSQPTASLLPGEASKGNNVSTPPSGIR